MEVLQRESMGNLPGKGEAGQTARKTAAGRVGTTIVGDFVRFA